jgi:hypothetical protein
MKSLGEMERLREEASHFTTEALRKLDPLQSKIQEKRAEFCKLRENVAGDKTKNVK